MNGLDAILNRIISEAEERVLEIQDQTRQRCDEILADADREAERLREAARQHAVEESAVLMRRSLSSATLEFRKRVLSARQALIDEVIDKAAVSLGSLPIRDKTELYTRLLIEHAGGSESVLVPKAEREFATTVIEAVNRAKGWQLTLADEPGDFCTGVILRQGMIETNLTTDLLVRSMRPELVSLAARTLFGS